MPISFSSPSLCGSETARPLNMYERRIASVLSGLETRERGRPPVLHNFPTPAQISLQIRQIAKLRSLPGSSVRSSRVYLTQRSMKKVPFFTVEERSDRPSARRQSGVGSARRRASGASSRRPTTFAPLLFVEIIVIAMHEVIWWPC